ncbi:MAG TPA: hypothetical protein VNO70_26085 [Blastocatellia bacterium]|nr:hypothetical protein [Blastocatellia bacterium]
MSSNLHPATEVNRPRLQAGTIGSTEATDSSFLTLYEYYAATRSTGP